MLELVHALLIAAGPRSAMVLDAAMCKEILQIGE
jgi:hypothetical protein